MDALFRLFQPWPSLTQPFAYVATNRYYPLTFHILCLFLGCLQAVTIAFRIETLFIV